MVDQTPGEMVIALRQDKIDLALTLHGIDLLSRDSMLVNWRLLGALLRFPSATGSRPKDRCLFHN
jgi:hypothetical protein